MTIMRDDPRFWDVRTLQRRLRKGQITNKDYEKYLKSLPDVDGKKATLAVADIAELDEDEDDDDDEGDGIDAGANGVHTE